MIETRCNRHGSILMAECAPAAARMLPYAQDCRRQPIVSLVVLPLAIAAGTSGWAYR